MMKQFENWWTEFVTEHHTKDFCLRMCKPRYSDGWIAALKWAKSLFPYKCRERDTIEQELEALENE